jgi:hypothetical protein
MNRLSSILKNDLISLLDQNKSIIEIALLYNTSDSSIRRWMHRLELSNRIKSKRSFTEEELNLIKTEYISGSGFHEIALLLNATGPGIEYVLKVRLGIKTREIEHHKHDRSFFKSIDTENKAYWLGFIYADGCVYNTSLLIALKDIDTNHLEKFRTDLQMDKPLTSPVIGTSRLEIYSRELVTDLFNLGIMANKSLICTPFLHLIPDQLQRHFWRGVIDGDGHIAICKNKYKDKIYYIVEFGITGNLNTCTVFSNWALQKHGLKFSIGPDKSVFRSRMSKTPNNIRKALKVFYGDANIFLDRKMQKAISLINDGNKSTFLV